MAHRHYTTQIGTTATAIIGTEYPGFILKNTGSGTVYIGDSNVVATANDIKQGYPLDSGDVLEFSYDDTKSLTGKTDDRLYGIVSNSHSHITCLVKGRVLN